SKTERRTLHAGHRQDHADRIAERTGHVGQLLALQRAARDLENLALALDDRLIRVRVLGPHPQTQLELLVLVERHRAQRALALILDAEDAIRAGRDAVEEERAVLARRDIEAELDDRHDRTGHLAARSCL